MEYTDKNLFDYIPTIKISVPRKKVKGGTKKCKLLQSYTLFDMIKNLLTPEC